MGWSETRPVEDKGLFSWCDGPTDFYYVHGFYAPLEGGAGQYAAATCEYGEPFIAAVQYRNIHATQFHPEKSQLDGLRLLKNFLDHA